MGAGGRSWEGRPQDLGAGGAGECTGNLVPAPVLVYLFFFVMSGVEHQRLAGHDGQQRVNLSTMPSEERWRHVKIAMITRVDDLYASATAPDENMTCDKGIRWKSLGVQADVTMAMGLGGTKVPILFLLQKPVLLAGFAAKDLSEARVGAL